MEKAKASVSKKSKRDYEKELVEGQQDDLWKKASNPLEKDWDGATSLATTATWLHRMSTQGPTQRCFSTVHCG